MSAGEKMTIAVTGAGGLVGSLLCEHLRSQGHAVRSLVRDPSAGPWEEKGIPAFACDLPGHIDPRGIDGAQVVIHCAYMTRYTSQDEARLVNVKGTGILLEMTRAAGGRFVFISSNSARPDAPSFYARSKYECERMLDLGREAAVRPGLVLSERGGLALRIAALVNKLSVLPAFASSGRKIQTVHQDDLAAALAWVLETGFAGRLTVAEAGGVDMRGLIKLMARALGKKRLVINLPPGPFVYLLQMAEGLGIRLPLSSENLRGLIGLAPGTDSASALDMGLAVRSAGQSLADLDLAAR